MRLPGIGWKINMSSPSTPINKLAGSRNRAFLAITAAALAAIAAGYAAFWLCTFLGTAEMRSASSDPDAGLVWLRREFHLTDAQFQRIRALHAAYATRCDVMCQEIMNANAALDAAISRNQGVTAEVQQALAQVSRVQLNCRQSMLAHMYDVSAQMDPSSAERYLRMMKQKIIQPGLSSATAVSQ
jgi:hypothetical protein